MLSSGVIGCDILDIGSSKAEMRAKRQRGISAAMGPSPLVFGTPGQFDVPNVEDVRNSLSGVELRR